MRFVTADTDSVADNQPGLFTSDTEGHALRGEFFVTDLAASAGYVMDSRGGHSYLAQHLNCERIPRLPAET